MFWLLLACVDVCPAPDLPDGLVQAGPVSFERSVLDAGICGPSFVEGVDLDGDGAEEAVITTFGRMRGISVPNGTLSAYGRDGVEVLFDEGADLKWPNGVSPHDMDGDGDPDLVVGLGFLTCQIDPFTQQCGGLVWLENPSWTVHEVVAPGAEGFYHHAAFADLDGDGHADLIAANESQSTPLGTTAESRVQVFRGPDYTAQESLGEGLGSFITPFDVDADGDLDLLGASFWGVESEGYTWMENTDGWPSHAIDTDSGPAIQLALLDPDPIRLIGSNHVGEGDPQLPTIALYEPGEDVREPWTETVLSTDFFAPDGAGSAAPGVIALGDIDGDGDTDLLVSGDGDGDIHWIEQDGDDWHHHVLDVDLPQAGVALVDMDGDGRGEPVVSSWEQNIVLHYVPQ